MILNGGSVIESGKRRLAIVFFALLAALFASALLADPTQAQAVLEVTKNDSEDPVVEGEQFTYTITVQNTGDMPTTSVTTLTDDLPDQVGFVSVSVTEGNGTCTDQPDSGDDVNHPWSATWALSIPTSPPPSP